METKSERFFRQIKALQQKNFFVPEEIAKPGRKKGSGEKNDRFNMRHGAHFRNKLAWLRSYEFSAYKGMTDSEIVEKLVDDTVLTIEVLHGKIWNKK